MVGVQGRDPIKCTTHKHCMGVMHGHLVTSEISMHNFVIGYTHKLL